ncbi:MAG: hypothetical protein IKQ76_02415 [Bacteroidales bacterium]|nr:hypothetical protein [Bacteroidales bacterium]
MKRSFADILSSLDEGRAQKVARKLPAWAAAGIEIPSALALEQCSSSATASYKAGLAAACLNGSDGQCFRKPVATHGLVNGGDPTARLGGMSEAKVCGSSCPSGRILDLTGGLGVDSWAFSQVAERVVYFEQNAELAAAAARNFAKLGADNIEVRNETVTPETELPEADLIYADPARRSAAGRKVFLLEDCTPDILTLLPMLLRKAPVVLLKLSPMADLAMLAGRLGSSLREIHVVESDGEVKELLCLLVRDSEPAEPQIIVAMLTGQFAASRSGQLPPETSGDSAGPLPLPAEAGPSLLRSRGWLRFPEAVAADVQQEGLFCFRATEERAAEAVYAAGVQAGDTLLEPCPALLKAGAFKLPCGRWGLQKLAPSTHLYLGEAAPFFKAWRVAEVLPFGATAFKQLKRSYPRAEVTARNLPLGSDALRKKLGVAPGGDVHIFGCRLADGRAVLLVCTR